MNRIFKLIALILIVFSPYIVDAQGCSDAGFCTINSLKPNDMLHGNTSTNQFKVGLSLGSADHSVNVFSSYLEYSKQVSSKLNLSGKLTSSAQSGNGISSSGLSDFFLTANYSLSNKTKLVVGTKIPLNNANKKENGVALPMDYQSSLGTVDLILGLGHQFEKLQLVFALQQPLSQNSNQFIATTGINTFQNFHSTRKFNRSGDILLRLSYPLELSKKLKLTPSILPIYHLSNDKYTGLDNIEREIEGSNGLTLNANAYLDYEINDQNAIQLSLGMPLAVRDNRPDGLTRNFVAQVEYRITF